jgi:hypothetical protein
MAYSTASAIKRFSSSDGSYEDHTADSKPYVLIINKSSYIQDIKGFDIKQVIQSCLDRQAGKLLAYIRKALRDRRKEHLR